LTGDSTTGANAAAVRRGIDAYNAGDVGGLLAMADPDIEWEVAPEHPAAATHRGYEAIGEYLGDWQNTLDDIHIDVRSISERGDSVLALCQVRGKGGESGAAVEVEIAFLTTFRDGKAIRVEEFLDADEALRALESTQ
jgi:ketosteroid isomerase-like protein